MNAPILARDFTAAPVRGIESAPPAFAKPNRGAHAFDMPPAMHVGVFGGFAAYLAIMWAIFASPELAIPFVIFAVTIAAGFIVPAYWARVARSEGPKDSVSDFMRDGIACATGRITGGEAMAQMMIMPAMLLLWGIGIGAIVAFAGS